MNAQPASSFPAQNVPATIVGFPRRSSAPLNLTVFLAENDPGSRAAFSTALTSLGCRVVEFSTGIEAIEAAAEETPDALLLDARLPDTDALLALAELKGDPATRDIPVVVLAASLLRDEEPACIESGAHAFLTKPASIEALFTALASLGKTRAV